VLNKLFCWNECKKINAEWVIHAPQIFPHELLDKLIVKSIFRMIVKDMTGILIGAIKAGKFDGNGPPAPYYPCEGDFYLTNDK